MPRARYAILKVRGADIGPHPGNGSDVIAGPAARSPLREEWYLCGLNRQRQRLTGVRHRNDVG